jgi:hypothetical protein
MSSRGISRAELERRRQEQIRKEQERKRQDQVRANAQEMCAEVEAIIFDIASTNSAGHIRMEMEEVTKIREEAISLLKSDVDAAEQKASQSKSLVNALNELAESRMQEKQMELDRVKLELEATLMQIRKFQDTSSDSLACSEAELLASKLLDANDRITRGIRTGIESEITVVKTEMEQIKVASSERSVAEECRKHIVKSLRDSMQELGFIVGNPKIIHEAGQVVLEGRMANGRLAQFRVSVDGEMEFDLEGYVGRECSNHLDAVLEEMRDRYGVNCSPPQHNWKNPDRISKGSKDFPTGGSSKQMGGGA